MQYVIDKNRDRMHMRDVISEQKVTDTFNAKTIQVTATLNC